MIPTPPYLVVRGARGSLPTPAPRRERYGGSTTCLEVVVAPDRRILVDCGTGLVAVQEGLAPGVPLRCDVLFTHFHLDHLLGLPFFAPLYSPGSSFVFHGRPWGGRTLRETLETVLAPPWFPVPLNETPAAKEYAPLDGGPLAIGGVRITHAELNHPQGVTAYRLEGARGSVVFATDYERGEPAADANLRGLGAGADVLLHDAQYTPEEYVRAHRGWGHSTWRGAIESARDLGVPRLVLFHHDPARSDEGVDALLADARREFPATDAAHEGMLFEL